MTLRQPVATASIQVNASILCSIALAIPHDTGSVRGVSAGVPERGWAALFDNCTTTVCVHMCTTALSSRGCLLLPKIADYLWVT